MSITTVFPEQYDTQLEEKSARMKALFAEFSPPEIEVFRSPVKHYRMRAEFKIWQQDDRANYAMFEPGEPRKPVFIDNFPVGSESINQLMRPLLDAVNLSEILRHKLFQIEFLSTLAGEVLVTMIYHKKLDEEWKSSAEKLQKDLGCNIIGRSRKQKCVLTRDYVTESLNVGGRVFTYQQVESGFTQPNAKICEDMLNWAVNCSEGLSGDLLELYCGNGNFTAPLATQFRKVLATEISKTSVKSAEFNFVANDIENVQIARMSSEEFSEAMDKVRAFRRLKDIDLDSYEFSTIFVDPPRAGMDEHTTEVAKGFDNILYISCNPNTLKENLASIYQTHQIERIALFDQFPYTEHMECGMFLSRRKT